MWFFNCPQIVFGEDALSWLSQVKGYKAFIVTDENMVRLGFVRRVQEQLSQANIECGVFAEIEPDPSLHSVKRCADALLIYGPDWVIGLGGGSCLDAAKASWFLFERPDVQLDEINPLQDFGLRTKARFLTISTTSGTGSDVSWGFALSDTDDHSKLVRVSRELVPDITIVDPSLVIDMPAQITADSGMDALAHAIEAYTCSWHNDFTDGLCMVAIQLIFKYLPRAYHNGADFEARQRMHNAATIAGLGFSNTAIILAHALAHAVGGVFQTQHGRTVGMFLPYTIEYLMKAGSQRYAQIAKIIDLTFESDEEGALRLVAEIRQLAHSMGQPLSIRELGVSQSTFYEKMDHMIEKALAAPELVSTPRVPYLEEMRKLLEYAYEGRPVDF